MALGPQGFESMWWRCLLGQETFRGVSAAALPTLPAWFVPWLSSPGLYNCRGWAASKACGLSPPCSGSHGTSCQRLHHLADHGKPSPGQTEGSAITWPSSCSEERIYGWSHGASKGRSSTFFNFLCFTILKPHKKLRSSKGNEAHEQRNQLYLCPLSSQISLPRAEEEWPLSSH